MSSWEEQLRRQLADRQKWETFGGKPVLAVWSVVAVLTLLWPFSPVSLVTLFALGVVVQVLLFIIPRFLISPRKALLSLELNLLWFVGALLAWIAASWGPSTGFVSLEAGRTLATFVWGGVTFYSGSVKNRKGLMVGGIVLAGLAIALATGLNTLFTAGLVGADFLVIWLVTKN